MSNPISQRILLTGVSGFIGGHLAKRLLQEGMEVYAIVRPESNQDSLPAGLRCLVHDGSMQSMLACLKEAQPDLVVHLASCFLARHTPDDIERLADSNLKFGLQLLEAMSVVGCKKFINTGTAWQHFENSVYDPVCLYAATKQAFEALMTYYVNVQQFQVITLKLHDTYGPGDPRKKLIALLIDAAQSGNPMELSPGEQKIDLTHIADVEEAYLQSIKLLADMESSHYQEYTITSGNLMTVQQIAAEIEKALDKKIHAHWGARPYREREVMVPAQNGKTVPGWQPKVTLCDGVKQFS